MFQQSIHASLALVGKPTGAGGPLGVRRVSNLQQPADDHDGEKRGGVKNGFAGTGKTLSAAKTLDQTTDGAAGVGKKVKSGEDARKRTRTRRQNENWVRGHAQTPDTRKRPTKSLATKSTPTKNAADLTLAELAKILVSAAPFNTVTSSDRNDVAAASEAPTPSTASDACDVSGDSVQVPALATSAETSFPTAAPLKGPTVERISPTSENAPCISSNVAEPHSELEDGEIAEPADALARRLAAAEIEAYRQRGARALAERDALRLREQRDAARAAAERVNVVIAPRMARGRDAVRLRVERDAAVDEVGSAREQLRCAVAAHARKQDLLQADYEAARAQLMHTRAALAEANARRAIDTDAVASPLATATIIADVDAVAYPEHIKPPAPGLNAGAAQGKFRYDREFLLQFRPFCRARPDNLPSLETIGLRETNGGTPAPGAPRRSSGQGPQSPRRRPLATPNTDESERSRQASAPAPAVPAVETTERGETTDYRADAASRTQSSSAVKPRGVSLNALQWLAAGTAAHSIALGKEAEVASLNARLAAAQASARAPAPAMPAQKRAAAPTASPSDFRGEPAPASDCRELVLARAGPPPSSDCRALVHSRHAPASARLRLEAPVPMYAPRGPRAMYAIGPPPQYRAHASTFVPAEAGPFARDPVAEFALMR